MGEQEEGKEQKQAGNIEEKVDNEKMAKGEEMPPLDKKSNNDIRQKTDGEEEEKDIVEGVQIDMVLKFSIGQIKRLCENTGQKNMEEPDGEGEQGRNEEKRHPLQYTMEEYRRKQEEKSIFEERKKDEESGKKRRCRWEGDGTKEEAARRAKK